MATDLNLPKQKVFFGPAMLWKRLVAFLIDILIVNFILIGPFRGIILALAGGTDSSPFEIISSPQNIQSIATVFGLIAVFIMAYFVLTEYLLGQTVGKMIMKLKVIALVEEKPLPGIGRCFIRSLFLLPVTPFYFLWVIDPIFLMFNKNNQRLTEFLSRTMTVQEYVV